LTAREAQIKLIGKRTVGRGRESAQTESKDEAKRGGKKKKTKGSNYHPEVRYIILTFAKSFKEDLGGEGAIIASP